AAAFATVSPLQLWVLRRATGGEALASSLNIGAFNLGNALGAWLGGVVIVHGPGLGAVAWAAMLVTLGGLGVALWARALQRRDDSQDNAIPSPATTVARARACDAAA